ncbi:unnamed protein product, partial [Amoebophrya sp. A120]
EYKKQNPTVHVFPEDAVQGETAGFSAQESGQASTPAPGSTSREPGELPQEQGGTTGGQEEQDPDSVTRTYNLRPVEWDTRKFPDVASLARTTKEKKLRLGWFVNNCMCVEHPGFIQDWRSNYDAGVGLAAELRGDLAEVVDHDFASLKIDTCGAKGHVRTWVKELDAIGQQSTILQHKSHGNGDPRRFPAQFATSSGDCAYHVAFTARDIHATFRDIYMNLQSVRLPSYVGPHCWASPGELQIGNTERYVFDLSQVGSDGDDTQTEFSSVEDETHFALWCITSSPLVLSFPLIKRGAAGGSTPAAPLRHQQVIDYVKRIVINKVAIAIDQIHVNDVGRRVYAWDGDFETEKIRYAWVQPCREVSDEHKRGRWRKDPTTGGVHWVDGISGERFCLSFQTWMDHALVLGKRCRPTRDNIRVRLPINCNEQQPVPPAAVPSAQAQQGSPGAPAGSGFLEKGSIGGSSSSPMDSRTPTAPREDEQQEAEALLQL